MMDVVSDITVTMGWLNDGHWIWSGLQITILLYAQIFQAFAVAKGGFTPRILVFLGLGKLYYGARDFDNINDSHEWEALKV